MKRGAAILLLLVLAAAAGAADYLLETPGATARLEGRMTVADESQSIARTTTVIPATEVPGAPEGAICLLVRTESGGDSSEMVVCLERRAGGFYGLGTAERPGKKFKAFKEPALELPIPLAAGKSWATSDEKGKIHLDWSVVEIDPATGVAHLRARGEGKAMGMTIPIERESWVRPSGEKVREVIRQTIMGQQSVTTLETPPAAGSPGAAAETRPGAPAAAGAAKP